MVRALIITASVLVGSFGLGCFCMLLEYGIEYLLPAKGARIRIAKKAVWTR